MKPTRPFSYRTPKDQHPGLRWLRKLLAYTARMSLGVRKSTTGIPNLVEVCRNGTNVSQGRYVVFQSLQILDRVIAFSGS